MIARPASTAPYKALDGRDVILGVTGSIAAYKAADLASKLIQQGAGVDVIMTSSATEFIGPTTFAALTHRPVTTGMFEAQSELAIDHVALATKADVVVVAPATANTLAKLALGLADDPIGATVLAASAPVIVCPAMDAHMYDSAATQSNIEILRGRGLHVVEPAEGRLASGLTGRGRMEEPARVVEHVRWVLGRTGDFAGKKVVVSAGGTQEPLDPVRHIANRSSGRMGYAVAAAARDRGAQVTLVAGPTALQDPVGVEVTHVRTALEMRDAVVRAARQADLLVMAAAVADFRPSQTAAEKIKKGKQETLALELVRNPAVISEALGPKLVKVAFAAETGDPVRKAREKSQYLGAAFIVANDVLEPDSGFGADTNRVTFVYPDGADEPMPLMDKLAVAHELLDRARKKLK
jgi:phosphopantothenoylcysteine decarboxylase/phosphopantothenate--cysteine ligase